MIYILEPNQSLSLSGMMLSENFKLLMSQFDTEAIHLVYHPDLMGKVLSEDWFVGYFDMSKIVHEAYPQFMPNLKRNIESYSSDKINK